MIKRQDGEQVLTNYTYHQATCFDFREEGDSPRIFDGHSPLFLQWRSLFKEWEWGLMNIAGDTFQVVGYLKNMSLEEARKKCREHYCFCEDRLPFDSEVSIEEEIMRTNEIKSLVERLSELTKEM